MIAELVERVQKATRIIFEETDYGKGVVETDEVLERLAALEHKQWVDWAKNILETEEITKERAERWKDLFVAYDDLTEEMKEKDREWARKVLAIVRGEAKESIGYIKIPSYMLM